MDRVAPALADVGCREVELPVHEDRRGLLVSHEFDDLPFEPQRVFVVTGVPAGTTRGGHAHRTAWQLLHCPAGAIVVKLRIDGSDTIVTLDRAGTGLLVAPGVWSTQTFLTEGAVLIVLSSERYSTDSYLDGTGC